MRTLPIITLFLMLMTNCLLAQSIKPDSSASKRAFILGFDVMNASISVFSDNKLYQGYISTQLKKHTDIVADLGYAQNTYEKNGYDASTNGFFIKAGAQYMLIKDYENRFNGFYIGGKASASFYQQEYRKIPIQGLNSGDSFVTYPQSSQSSYWLEAVAGGRVQLFNSRFLIDVQVQPRYLLYSTKQEGIKPMIISGFGRASSNFNMGFSWSIAYQF